MSDAPRPAEPGPIHLVSETERPLVETANPRQPGDAKPQGLPGNFSDTSPLYDPAAPVVALNADTATVTCVSAKADNTAGGYYDGIANVGLAIA